MVILQLEYAFYNILRKSGWWYDLCDWEWLSPNKVNQLCQDVFWLSWSALNERDTVHCPTGLGLCCSHGFRGLILQGNTQKVCLCKQGKPGCSWWKRCAWWFWLDACHCKWGKTSQALIGLQCLDPVLPRNSLCGGILNKEIICTMQNWAQGSWGAWVALGCPYFSATNKYLLQNSGTNEYYLLLQPEFLVFVVW